MGAGRTYKTESHRPEALGYPNTRMLGPVKGRSLTLRRTHRGSPQKMREPREVPKVNGAAGSQKSRWHTTGATSL